MACLRGTFRASIFALALAAACSGCSRDRASRVEPANPYEHVDWQTFARYRADLHVHTLESDGCAPLAEVVRVFHDAGFSILAITDHDAVAPNFCHTRDAASQAQIDFGAYADEASPYPNPRPPNFPADTTWPWTAYGAPSPEALGMLGIEAAELTCGFHVGSFFNDYGTRSCEQDPPPMEEQTRDVERRGGLAILNHPFTDQKSLEWHTRLFREHSADSLVGLELAGDETKSTEVSIALWDQLLGALMPDRPIWGFGTSDLHLLTRTRFAFTVFLLNELTSEGVKAAMRSGQFYSVVGPKILSFAQGRGPRDDPRAVYDGTYPSLRAIVVDRDAQKISIDATGYDEIVWIARPSPSDAGAGAAAWRAGEIVQRGPVLDYSAVAATPYVRAEVIRNTDLGPVRLFLSPFALRRP